MKLKNYIILLAILILMVGCASFEVINTKDVAMIKLNKLYHRGKLAGIIVPAKYGDFSISHKIKITRLSNELFALEFLPVSKKGWIFILFTLHNCPEAVALQAYNMNTEKGEYWVYDEMGIPKKVSAKKYGKALKGPFDCHNKRKI